VEHKNILLIAFRSANDQVVSTCNDDTQVIIDLCVTIDN